MSVLTRIRLAAQYSFRVLRGHVDATVVPLPEGRVLRRTAFGHYMVVDMQDSMLAPALAVDGYWELATAIAFRSLLSHDDTLLEVGCNIGYYTLLAAMKLKRDGAIVSFDANEKVIETARDSLRYNGALRTATLIHSAVSDSVGTVTFQRMTKSAATSTLYHYGDDEYPVPDEAPEFVDVPCTTLDTWCEENDFRPSILRIDAEGAEAAIFRGMARLLQDQNLRKIVFEYCPEHLIRAGVEPVSILKTLEEAGFQLFEIDSLGGLVRRNVTDIQDMALADVVGLRI
ncbi:MAG: FkbM family methyltransferase [Myxococcales bacterium]|nr:FkbM family methyltransferase [Myxococcales bacterium]